MTMPFDDFLRRIRVKKHADAEARQAHCSTGHRKEVLPEPRPFTHPELESYLEHFKTCKRLHFPDPQVRYYRKFSRTCKLHADYIRSFDNTVLIEICCGELIPYADYAKLGHEEHSCEPTFVFIADWAVLLHGNHIPGLRHIYLELDEAFKTSKRQYIPISRSSTDTDVPERPDRKNFPANGFVPDEEEEEEKRIAKEKSIKEQAEIWARILAKEYEDDQRRRAQRSQLEDEVNEVEEEVDEPSPSHRLYILTRQRSETV
jgi:hypothetical protein